ncbi:MCE family protein [Mycobacterium xenopi]|uniref:Uncharacterized protein n=1 Tax=Mycobacterium xenopi TaxID=1789 RepID=A0AAD1GYQ3_MYCXE|nr:MCE family protein [Mycobacterium xenopi]MDA3640503.1 MCE family protein [Mycobacterium xenopi]MDA3657951.1 MCE family protein [Mycobacterium xenopi]MDA3662667.1 MCE family protein [Mycobacterium xenopi]SPX78864.1 virulence factor Mce family protein [Mycobacterium xenopi]BBU21245.1 hypothetical protein MYXE_10340 [Mycobacterium xenopi]
MLTLIGTAVLLCVVLAVLAAAVNLFGGRPPDRISVAIDTPYVGQGVEAGTAVVLHGVQVGKVTDVALSPGGGVRLAIGLQKGPVAGLTDKMNIDFRPINYFGVPGVNIIPASGGQAVRDGSEISVMPKGNFTLSELLSQLGDVSAAALTPQLISVLDRVTRYTDGLNPLFETLVTVTKAVADVQEVSTARLLANTAPISAAYPAFANATINLAARVANMNYYPEPGDPSGRYPTVPPPSSPAASGRKLTPPYKEFAKQRDPALDTDEQFQNTYLRFLEIASGGLFLGVGTLLKSHSDDLLPLVNGIKFLSDPVPSLLRPADIARTLAELRSRFEKLYGGNGEQRALRVRILLDSLPGVAAPLGVQVVPPVAEGGPGR